MSSVIEQISQRIENGTMVYFRRKHNHYAMAYAVYTFRDPKGEWKIEFHNTFRGTVARSLEDLYIRSQLDFRHSPWGSEAQIRLSHKPDDDFPTADQILKMLRVKRIRSDAASPWDWSARPVVESTLPEIFAEDQATWNKDRQAYTRQKWRNFPHDLKSEAMVGMFPVGLELCYKPAKKPALMLTLAQTEREGKQFQLAATQRWLVSDAPTRAEHFHHPCHMEHWYRKHITPTTPDHIDYFHSPLEDMTFASGVFKGLGVLSVLDLDMGGWGDIDNYCSAAQTPHALFITETHPWKHFHTDNLTTMVTKFNERDSQEVKVKLCTNLMLYIQKEALDYTRAHASFRAVAIAKALEFRAICQIPENAGKENLAALLVICLDLLGKLGWKPPAVAAAVATATAAVPSPPPATVATVATVTPPVAVVTVTPAAAVASPPPVAVAAAVTAVTTVTAAPSPPAVDTEALSPLERLRLLEQKFALLEQKFALLQNLKGFIEGNKA